MRSKLIILQILVIATLAIVGAHSSGNAMPGHADDASYSVHAPLPRPF